MAILFGIGIVCYFIMIIAGGLESATSYKKMNKKAWYGIGAFVLGILAILLDAFTNAGGIIAILFGFPLFVGGLGYGLWNQ